MIKTKANKIYKHYPQHSALYSVQGFFFILLYIINTIQRVKVLIYSMLRSSTVHRTC